MSDLSTQASLRFLVPGQEKPVYFASQGGADAELNIRNAEFLDRRVDIADARQLQHPASIDREGFELHSHVSEVDDFYQLADQQQFYEAELRELVLDLTGAREVLVFDHTLRSNSPELRARHNTREAAALVHNDYTYASAHKRVRDLLPPEEAERRLQKRFAIINVWRSIAGPVIEAPMTCCDAQTLDEADCIASERRARDRIGELELVSFNPCQRWYYYPEMKRDEVLILKTYDSAETGHARRSVHTAFANPLAPPDAAPRESIESRMLIFY